MDQISRLIEDIITLAEAQEDFYEVEASVLIRRNNGAQSDFVRMQLEAHEGVSHKVTKQSSCTRASDQWF